MPNRPAAYNESVSFHGASEDDIAAALQALKNRLTAELGDSLERLVLYGSRARGDHEPDSDIDLAVVVRGMDRHRKNELLDLVADIELEYLVPLSTLVISSKDFAELKKHERRIALDIEAEGVPL